MDDLCKDSQSKGAPQFSKKSKNWKAFFRPFVERLEDKITPSELFAFIDNDPFLPISSDDICTLETLGVNTFQLIEDIEDVIDNGNPPDLGNGDDGISPQVTAALLDDTSPDGMPPFDSDGITFDPTIAGTVLNLEELQTLSAGFNDAQPNDFFDITSDVLPDGTFALDDVRLAQILGDDLDDDDYTLMFQAVGFNGNVSEFELDFTLDTAVDPEPIVDLAAPFDSGVKEPEVTVSSQNREFVTILDEVTISGTTEPGALVTLFGGLNEVSETIADVTGFFSFTGIQLDPLDPINGITETINNFELDVLDVAGNAFFNDDSTLFSFDIRLIENSDPEFQGMIDNISLDEDSDAIAIDLVDFFSDEDIGHSLATFRTNAGDFTIETFDRDAPKSVANFFNYLEDGDYDDTFFHRSAPGFVVQGGRFRLIENGDDPSTLEDNVNDRDPTVDNEFGISNTRGTVSFAKSGPPPGQPPNETSINSATIEFFVNLGDNSQNLDNQNGGFTVWGEVASNLELFDNIDDGPRFDVDSPPPFPDLDDVPIEGFGFNSNPPNADPFPATWPDDVINENLFVIEETEMGNPEKLTYEITSASDMDFLNQVLTLNNRLIIDPVVSGSSTIQISATDSQGVTVVSNVFTITVN